MCISRKINAVWRKNIRCLGVLSIFQTWPIPVISVFLCRYFKIAQGEKNEELVLGILLGLALNLLIGIILLLFTKMSDRKDKKQ